MTALPPSEEHRLTPPQREVHASGLLSSGFDCLLHMPTGSGKTWLAETAMDAVLSSGRRALYLTPLRALAAELSERWRERFAPRRVGVFTGDYGREGKRLLVPFRDARLLILTPERLDACTRCWSAHWSWLPEVDLVVVDELHLLGEGWRGARLEGTLSRLRRLNPLARLLGLSATLGNRAELADWLGAVDYASSWRPVPLRWRVLRYRQADEKPALLQAAVTAHRADGGKSLVFVQSRRRAEELCGLLQRAGLAAAHHHAGLSPDERRDVETRLRSRALDVIVATATLEMGLNLPVRQVVLYDLQAFDGNTFRPLSTNSVWQRAGRAGRPGLDAQGEVVLLAAAWDRAAAEYTAGHFEPIRSGLSDRRAVAEQILVEIASGMVRSVAPLRRVFATSLAAWQKSLADVDAVLAEMGAAGMIQCEDAKTGEKKSILRATRLGWIAVRHFLDPGTLLLFRRVLHDEGEWTFFDLLLLAASSPHCEPLLTVDYEDVPQLAQWLAGEHSQLLRRSRTEIVTRLGINGKRILAALQTARAARLWTRCGTTAETADEIGCYPFEIERLRDSLTRLLAAMAAVDAPSEPRDGMPTLEVGVRERLHLLQRMVAAGLDEEAATLTRVPGLGAKMARRLRTAGIADLEALAQAEPRDLHDIRGLSPTRAAQWIEQALTLLPSGSAYHYRESGPPLGTLLTEGPRSFDPYRLRRACELRVETVDDGIYQVRGGLEPHRVRQQGGRWLCDCADAAEGQICKHVLAVRLHRNEPEVQAAVERPGTRAGASLDLFDLWFDQNPSLRERTP